VIRKSCIECRKIEYELVGKIHELLAERGIDVGGGVDGTLSKISSAIMLIGKPEPFWPDLHRYLVEHNYIRHVNDLAFKISKENSELVSRLRKIHEQALKKLNETLQELNKALRMQKLEGKCNLI